MNAPRLVQECFLAVALLGGCQDNPPKNKTPMESPAETTEIAALVERVRNEGINDCLDAEAAQLSPDERTSRETIEKCYKLTTMQ